MSYGNITIVIWKRNLFAVGAFVGIAICAWTFRKKDDERFKESAEISKRIEDRMATQVETMVACLEEIKKNKKQ